MKIADFLPLKRANSFLVEMAEKQGERYKVKEKNKFVVLCSFDRHYKQAYGHLLELRMHDTNLLEIKTIAGFINYKVSTLILYQCLYLPSVISFLPRNNWKFTMLQFSAPDKKG